MILLIDNYDSFTFNLYQMIVELGYPCQVMRNDELTLQDIACLNPSHIVISPGPGRPENAGIILEVIKTFGCETPILGVCLGHQAIGLSFGAEVVLAPQASHGICSTITHNQQGLFAKLPLEISVARYHSLMVESLPECLEVTATSQDGVVMGIRHRLYPIMGVQFHPESYATMGGRQMLENFLGEVA